ncbi:hypothetical protein PDJ82_25430 [Bacillus cereus group sp. TH43LC]|uniref:hypothetical protein n=1 Tax=Bacillus cereus group TaxID=86661 RepID=UPI000772308C|nr:MULTISPECIES: hypothetical protein [Bacillus cereus group]KXI66134.1 hypothetical protein ACS51_25600 [Bacillus cereus]MCC2436350.1 hypothetical protein [Bacillus paranthracis]MDA1504922.1 hypothetical protein [Bacillus cereus group sp. TH43LC]MDA1541945.1 hypothetical protein [Bacillus cereus group sp. TH244-1LC]MDA1862697.1 hypothetical protein [Bacillus cereus group sp. BY128LC]
MTQFKFDFEKTYKEVDVAGKLFKVEFNDDALNKYQKALKQFKRGTDELQSMIPDFEAASDKEIDALTEKQKDLTKQVVETFLGEGTFEDLYEIAGRAVANLLNLVHYLNDIYVEESMKTAEKSQSKYLANLKK